jgi:hypothetical protein
MSLRVFHIVFIVICIAFCVCVTAWGIREYVHARSMNALLVSGTFLLFAGLLVAYSGKAFRKLRDL